MKLRAYTIPAAARYSFVRRWLLFASSLIQQPASRSLVPRSAPVMLLGSSKLTLCQRSALSHSAGLLRRVVYLRLPRLFY